MARRTKQDAEKTRQVILTAALDVIFVNGLANTSLEKIAKKASVTRGAVYWHFTNKNALFEVMLSEWLEPTKRMSEQWLIDEPPSLVNLKSFMVNWLAQIEMDPQLFKLFSILFFKVEQIGEVKILIDQAKEQADQELNSLQFYLGVLKQGHQLTKSTDTELFSVIISSFLMGMAQHWLSRPDAYSLSERAPQLVEQFMSGHQQVLA